MSYANVQRTEIGFTDVSLRIANLLGGFAYAIVVHTLPCVTLNGGTKYVRNTSCVGQLGTAGCEDTPSNTLQIDLDVSESTGVAEVTERFPHIARAGAQSLLLMDCRCVVMLLWTTCYLYSHCL